MSDRPSSRALRFGDFELDVPAYELRKRGRAVKLERLAMDLLILLVEERDRLIPRNEIVERLWGPDVFLEVDASVNTLVRKLRRVLGDAVEHPRFIQTVQGKGYRFIATVETTFPIGGGPQIETSAPAAIRTIAGAGDGAATERDPAAANQDPLQRSKPSPMPFALPGLSGRQRVAANVALLVLSVLMMLGARTAWSRLHQNRVENPPRVAVMPFENLTGDPDREYVADGVTEETAASLGQIIDSTQAMVIGRVSTKGYKGTRKSVAEIGRELSVAYLIVGTIRAEDQRLHITSNLIRVEDQAQVWSHSYDREPVSMLAMQQELGAAVAEEVRLQLSPDRLDALARRQTQNAEAYDLYLKGRYLWNQLTPPTTKRAMEAYGRATALDPNYALAWSGIADALTTGPIMGDADPRAVQGPARDAAERALKAGNMLAEPHTSAAVQKFFLEWDWRGAEAGFRRSIQIDGSYAMAHRMLGVVLSHGGRHTNHRASDASRQIAIADSLVARPIRRRRGQRHHHRLAGQAGGLCVVGGVEQKARASLFRDHVDDSALDVAELGGGADGLHVHFLDEVDARLRPGDAIARTGVVHPVEEKLVLVRARTECRDRGRRRATRR